MARKADALYREVLRKVSIANKRLKRLEKNNLQEVSPAYRAWKENGEIKFSVRGKNRRELERELIRLDNFLNAESSTVRGANALMKNIAKTINVKGTIKELKVILPNFFEVASKLEQILRNQNEVALSMGYQQIWQAIRTEIKGNSQILQGLKNDENKIEDIAKKYLNQLAEDEIEDVIESVHNWLK